MVAKKKAVKKAKPAKSAPKKAKKIAPAKKSPAKLVAKAAAKEAPKKIIKAKAETVEQKRRSKAEAAMEDALGEAAESAESEEEEFDPAAFYAASGGKGQFKSHTMRKERVDINITVRYRFTKGPLVFNADLINLSKGGLCLKTPDIVKNKTVLKVEIPLPHTSELFAVQAEVVWSVYVGEGSGKNRPIHTGLRFLPMSLEKQSVINQFIQQRRDEVVMAKIGLDKFTDSVPVAGLD